MKAFESVDSLLLKENLTEAKLEAAPGCPKLCYLERNTETRALAAFFKNLHDDIHLRSFMDIATDVIDGMTESQRALMDDGMKVRAAKLYTDTTKYTHAVRMFDEVKTLHASGNMRGLSDCVIRQLESDLGPGLDSGRESRLQFYWSSLCVAACEKAPISETDVSFAKQLATSPDEHPYHKAIGMLLYYIISCRLYNPVPKRLYSAVQMLQEHPDLISRTGWSSRKEKFQLLHRQQARLGLKQYVLLETDRDRNLNESSNAFYNPGGQTFTSIEGSCTSEQASSQAVYYGCLCKQSNAIVACYVNACSADPTFGTAKNQQTSYCQAANQLASTTAAAVPTGIVPTQSGVATPSAAPSVSATTGAVLPSVTLTGAGHSSSAGAAVSTVAPSTSTSGAGKNAVGALVAALISMSKVIARCYVTACPTSPGAGIVANQQTSFCQAAAQYNTATTAAVIPATTAGGVPPVPTGGGGGAVLPPAPSAGGGGSGGAAVTTSKPSEGGAIRGVIGSVLAIFAALMA
ncbi:hypothetical protein HDU98_003822 [Podochytrium sp. JEL0797]|nr:hypothetical protein HDU98_003822 [Podochytrium sp. JEL0797]